jgi:hypothetical protein
MFEQWQVIMTVGFGPSDDEAMAAGIERADPFPDTLAEQAVTTSEPTLSALRRHNWSLHSIAWQDPLPHRWAMAIVADLDPADDLWHVRRRRFTWRLNQVSSSEHLLNSEFFCLVD